MFKKIFGTALVLFLLVFAVSAGYAVTKGVRGSQQSIVKVGENVVVPEGAEVESAVSVGGSVTVSGHVKEDVVAVGGSVFLKEMAMVDGDAVSIGGNVVKAPGAIVKGDVVEVAVAGVAPMVSFFTKEGGLRAMALFSVMSFIGFLILTIVLVAIFTPQLGAVSASVEKSLWGTLWRGLLIAILFVPVIILLAVSLVGIVLIPVWIILVAAAGLFGYIAVGHVLGKQALRAFRIVGRSMMTETLVGVVLLALVGIVPIAGGIIKMVAILCGLGGVYQTRFGIK